MLYNAKKIAVLAAKIVNVAPAAAEALETIAMRMMTIEAEQGFEPKLTQAEVDRIVAEGMPHRLVEYNTTLRKGDMAFDLSTEERERHVQASCTLDDSKYRNTRYNLYLRDLCRRAEAELDQQIRESAREEKKMREKAKKAYLARANKRAQTQEKIQNEVQSLINSLSW